MAPDDSPTTARRIFMARQSANEKAARALRNIKHELRKSIKKLREHMKEKKQDMKVLRRTLFGHTLHRQQTARTQAVHQRRTAAMFTTNMNTLKSIIGDFTNLANMDIKYFMYVSPHGGPRMIDPRVHNVYFRLRPQILQLMQQQARQSELEVARLQSQIGMLQHQMRVVSSMRPRI